MRIKRGSVLRRRHKKVLKQAKGFKWGRKNVFSHAKNAVMKAGLYSYTHRRTKKREFRRLWITRLSAALQELGYNYSTFQHNACKKMIILNRKVLSNMAIENPEVFQAVVEKVMK